MQNKVRNFFNKLENKNKIIISILFGFLLIIIFGLNFFTITVDLIIFGFIFINFLNKFKNTNKNNKIYKYLFLIILTLYLLWIVSFLIIESQVISAFNYKYFKNKYDCIIILGAGLKNGDKISIILKKRLNKSIEIYKNNNIKYIVVSGGQGNDEMISEAYAMKKYLVNKGIPQNKILMENQSTSTLENLKFSKKLLEFKNIKTKKIVVITNDFHSFRTHYLAKLLNFNIKVISSHTFFPIRIKYMIREYYAIIFAYVFL